MVKIFPSGLKEIKITKTLFIYSGNTIQLPNSWAAMGIPEGLIRYSGGIEETEGLIADLQQAFDQAL